MLRIDSEVLGIMAEVVKTGIQTLEPHGGDRGPGPFGGTFDWHSCVHAHWMLVSLERLAGLEEDPWLHERLTTAVLEREWAFLQENPAFERPYGRAWLALLLAELRLRRPHDRGLADLEGQLQAELLEYLQTSPFPEHPERDYPYLGTHNSWVFAHWMGALAQRLNGGDTDAYRTLYESRVTPVVEQLRRHEPVPNDFLDLGVMADLEVLMWRPGTAPARRPLSPVFDEINRENAHMAARFFQELWAWAASEPASVQKRFDALLAQEHLWRWDFHYASHFVPQFAWMAVYLSRVSERPV